jgi:hypothetical protein
MGFLARSRRHRIPAYSAKSREPCGGSEWADAEQPIRIALRRCIRPGADGTWRCGDLAKMSDNGAAAQQIGLQNWQTQMQNANNQMNPWLAGTTSLLQLGSAITPVRTAPAYGASLFTPSNPAS